MQCYHRRWGCRDCGARSDGGGDGGSVRHNVNTRGSGSGSWSGGGMRSGSGNSGGSGVVVAV